MTSTQPNVQSQKNNGKQPAGMPVRSNLRAGIILQVDIPEGTVVQPEVQAAAIGPVV